MCITTAATLLQESGNNQVVFMQLDLASLKSVRSFAETFLKTEPRLDILINNAGDRVCMETRENRWKQNQFGLSDSD